MTLQRGLGEDEIDSPGYRRWTRVCEANGPTAGRDVWRGVSGLALALAQGLASYAGARGTATLAFTQETVGLAPPGTQWAF